MVYGFHVLIVEVINDFLIQNTWDLQLKLINTIAHCNTEDNRIVCVHMCACLEKNATMMFVFLLLSFFLEN